MSVQGAMNQLMGTVGTLGMQITAPMRFAKEQQKAQESAQEKKTEEREKQLSALETELTDIQKTGNPRTPQDRAQIIDNLNLARDIMRQGFMENPTKESYNRYKKARGQAIMGETLFGKSWDDQFKQQAEMGAFTRVADKIETQVNQATAMEERLDAIKLRQAATQMREEGAIKSNRQLKSILYHIGEEK